MQLRYLVSHQKGHERNRDNETSVARLLGENRGGVRFPWSCSYSRLMISQEVMLPLRDVGDKFEEHEDKNGTAGLGLPFYIEVLMDF